MQRVATSVLVAAVLALGLAAGVDALLGGGSEVEPTGARQPERVATTTEAAATEPTDAEISEAADDLLAAGITGVLTYADEDCRVHAVDLPRLTPQPAGAERSCRFQVSAGNVLSFGRGVADPSRFMLAACNVGLTDVSVDGRSIAVYPGCAPTWREDGVLTVVREGEVVLLDGPLDRPELVEESVLLSREAVTRAFRSAGWLEGRFTVREIVWLPGRRLAATVRLNEEDEVNDLLVVFRGRRLVRAPRFAYADLRGLRPSPRGRFVFARSGEGGLAIVDRGGRPVLEPFRHGQALAWSPDERWGAWAGDDGIYFFRSGDRSAPFIWVPIVARDLVWR
jgi:hypothetical protein